MTSSGDRLGILIFDGGALAMAGVVFCRSGPWEDACGPYGALLLAGAAGLGLYAGSQVVRGEARLRGMSQPILRAEEPLWFWLAVLPLALMAAIVAIIALFGAPTGA
ncbi:MAG TPA: hypothetical protein VEL07_17950 [Planctomycetota bacterium]|nr:hypothetical protein [Planctomycetota bacterium]